MGGLRAEQGSALTSALIDCCVGNRQKVSRGEGDHGGRSTTAKIQARNNDGLNLRGSRGGGQHDQSLDD